MNFRLMYFGQAIPKSNPFYMIIFILTEIGYGELQTIFFFKKKTKVVFFTLISHYRYKNDQYSTQIMRKQIGYKMETDIQM